MAWETWRRSGHWTRWSSAQLARRKATARAKWLRRPSGWRAPPGRRLWPLRCPSPIAAVRDGHRRQRRGRGASRGRPLGAARRCALPASRPGPRRHRGRARHRTRRHRRCGRALLGDRRAWGRFGMGPTPPRERALGGVALRACGHGPQQRSRASESPGGWYADDTSDSTCANSPGRGYCACSYLFGSCDACTPRRRG